MLSWAGMGSDSDRQDRNHHYLLVRSGGHRCAIPVTSARLVTGATEVYPLPNSAPRLLGLAQIDGEPVAVVDLHALLDPDGDPGGGHVLTVVVRQTHGRGSLALAVDEGFGVVAIDAPDPRPGDGPGWLAGTTTIDGRSVSILEPQRLFGPAGGG